MTDWNICKYDINTELVSTVMTPVAFGGTGSNFDL